MPRPTKFWTYIYFFQASASPYLVKIGESKQPFKRIKDLMIGSPVALIPVYMIKANIIAEELLHTAFADQWAHGEWFSPHPNLKALVRGWKSQKHHLLTPDLAEQTIPSAATFQGPFPYCGSLTELLGFYRQAFAAEGMGRRSRAFNSPVLAWRNTKVVK